MTSYGILARRGASGLWRRTHDLGGTDWELVLPMEATLARHLLERGMLSRVGESAADTLHPGIVVTGRRIEARLAMRHPATAFASADEGVDGLAEEGTPKALGALWCSDAATLQNHSRRTA